MNKLSAVIFIIFAIVIIASMNDNNPPAEMSVSDTSVKPTLRPNWPFIKEGGANNVADNLTRTNIYVVFDASGSMNDSGCSGNDRKIDAGKEALMAFAEKIPEDANIGLLTFDRGGVNQRISLSNIGAIHDRFLTEVKSIHAGGGTPLKTAITQAYENINQQARRQLGYGEYHMVVVTDGAANSGEEPNMIVNQLIGESPIVLHTIGFCISTNHSLNQPGKVIYQTAQDTESLRKGLDSVLAEAPEFAVSEFN